MKFSNRQISPRATVPRTGYRDHPIIIRSSAPNHPIGGSSTAMSRHRKSPDHSGRPRGIVRNRQRPEPEIRLDGGSFVLTILRPATQSAPSRNQVGTKSGPVTLRLESRPESMEIRILKLLTRKPLGKADLSAAMGQKAISGQLNKVIRILVADQTIEPTIPEKPTSRLQKYRLTQKGRRLLEQLEKEGGGK